MATSICIRYGEERKNFLVYTGIPVEELKSILRGAFNLNHPVVGLCDPSEDVHYPIAIVSRAPSFFTAKPYYELNVLFSEHGDDDDDDDDEFYEQLENEAYPEIENSDVFHLTENQTNDLLDLFKEAAVGGQLNRESFEIVFEAVLGIKHGDSTFGSTLSKLFDLFDRDGNGLVDAREFQTGLSVIGTSGNKSNEIRKAFEAYDLDGNGYISLDEMVTYLTSVFSVLATSSPEVFETNNVTPSDLATATALKCFEDLGVQTDGRLDFDQFQTWYTSADSQNLITMETKATEDATSTNLPSLDVVREITGLGGLDALQVFKLFADKAPSGVMSRNDFLHCFELIKPVSSFQSHNEVSGYNSIIDKLFIIFDADGDGVVDFTELASGLSVLCGGSRDDKVLAAFSMFDTNGDGFITKEEMTTYLTSVFKVMYQASPSEAYDVSPEALAKATAEQCFVDADANHDGRLNFEEFKNWYSDPSQTHETESASIVKKLEEINKIEEIKNIANIESYTITSLIDFFSGQASEDGYLTKEAFFYCFKELIDRNPVVAEIPEAQLEHYTLGLLDFVFRLFDTDHNGVVDLSEVGAGLSVICGGARDDKVMAAFALFDEDGDGRLTEQELVNYLTAVYKVLFESTPQTKELAGVSPLELATNTAAHYFESPRCVDGLVSFSEFQEWYNDPSGMEETEEDTCFSFTEMSTLTNLATTHVDTVFQMLAHSSDENGVLSQVGFNGCFRALIGASLSRDEYERADQLLHFIFHMFDDTHSGLVSFDHLASGISILCGGHHSEKIRSVFDLYDIDGTGFITKDEMISYLTSVFTVLLKTSPETQQRLGVSPADFAQITAESVFANNDVLSFDQFEQWCSTNVKTPQFVSQPVEQKEEELAQVSRSLDDIRRLSQLESTNIEDVFEAFAECADEDGLISRGPFIATMSSLIYLQRGDVNNRLANEIFDIFDADGNGVVDFTELASGLSLLCGGSRDDKVMAAFRLFDINGDGFITRDEMMTYLTSVFKVIYATRPELASSLGVGAEALSEATTNEAFENADLNQDGSISFPEFQLWYSQGIEEMIAPAAKAEPPVDGEVSLDYVREASGLQRCDVHTMFAIFADAASNDGLMSCEAYFECFGVILDRFASGEPDFDKLNEMLLNIFRVYDMQGIDSVELIELLCGMTVLCGGNREEKVKAAFGLIDVDNDGYISQEELFAYLRSIFKMLHDTKRDSQVEVDASTLAAATTTAAFTQAKTSQSGLISLTEFTNWYSNAASFEVSTPNQSNIPSSPSTFDRARWLLNLDKHSLNDLLDTLVEAGPDGTLSRDQFLNAMLLLVRLGGNLDPQTSEFDEAASLMAALFSKFDSSDIGRVDLSQIASGLSILCSVPMSEKIDFAFALYDLDGDGQVAFAALSEYMSSVFKVLFVSSPELESMVDGDLDTETLAEATTIQAFKEAGLPRDAKLEKQLFQNFVRIGLGSI